MQDKPIADNTHKKSKIQTKNTYFLIAKKKTKIEQKKHTKEILDPAHKPANIDADYRSLFFYHKVHYSFQFIKHKLKTTLLKKFYLYSKKATRIRRLPLIHKKKQ